ncbi:MAG: prepilin-type N-terminal cleavage/methylation domain-containing protein [Armatimonadota bacterium]
MRAGINRRQGGASLVEVLVAILVLAIAILAFIRLYPSGFLALKRTGQSEAATRLAQQELERLKGRQDNLPYMIAPVKYEVVEGHTVLVIDPTTAPDDMGVQPNLPQGVPPEYASGVNRIRRIIGERVNLGAPAPYPGSRSNMTTGILYQTAFAPIAVPPVSGGPAWDPIESGYLLVYGNPMRRFVMDSDWEYRWNLQLYEYGIDYERGKVLLRPLRHREIAYKIDYSYRVQHEDHEDIRQVSTVIVLPPTDPQRPFPVWADLTIPVPGRHPRDYPPVNQDPDFQGLVPDSDSAARLFERLAPDDAWDPDYPYQYKVVNQLLGLLAFNPAGTGFVERYWRGERPLIANIDYNVYDWSILREDHTVPSTGRIRLTFTDIKQYGDLLENQTQYRGLNLPGIEERDQPDIVLVDMLTGQVAYIQKGTLLAQSTLSLGSFEVDYLAGVIQLHNPNLRGRKLRVLYKAHENWALAVQKAAHRYFLSPVLDGMPADACWYDAEAAFRGEPVTKLYFNRSEAGKTVLLREYWYWDGNTTRRGVNGVLRISETPDSTGFVYADLREIHPNAQRWAPEVTGVAIRGVQGLSLKVRLYYEPDGRKVKIDFDALLTRKD